MTGQTILHYRVLEKLGAGGMGEIYKAQDTRLSRLVAVKILSPRLSAEPERRKRFFQEARAASALNHPNIITLHDIISEGEVQCIVMEYVAGKTLRDLIPTGGLTVPQAVKYSTQMASALAAAHAAGIIHRDLKPSNVMITPSGLVKILDFGLAKWIDPALAGLPGEQSTVEQGLTTEGSILGTVSYMSPEQAVGKKVDTRSDIFSFGSVMYEMVTGRRAFEGSSGISTLSSILRDEVRPIKEIASGVPEGLEQIVARCLPKDPDARWQSMKEIEGRLVALERRLDTGSGPYPVPVSSPASSVPQAAPPAAAAQPAPKSSAAPRPKRTRLKPAITPVWGWSLLGVILFASASAGAWWLWRNSQHQPSQSIAAVTPPEPATPTPPPSPPTPQPEAAPAEPAPAAANPAPEPAPAAPKSEAPKKRPTKSTRAKSEPPAPLQPPVSNQTPAPPAPPAPAVVTPPTAPAPKAAPPAPPIQLIALTVTDGLPIPIVLADDVPADTEQGTTLRFTVAEDVRVGANVVIAKGAAVSGLIAQEAAKKKFFAFGGRKITFELQQVDSADGKKLKVRATSARPADGPAARPLDAGKGSKPKGLAAAQGTEYIAYIDGEQIISLSK